MPSLSFDNLYLFFFFVVPGLIMSYVRQQFIGGRVPSTVDKILVYFVLSVVYQSLTLPVLGYFTIQPAQFGQPIIWICLILACPALLGFILGAAAQKSWGSFIPNQFGLITNQVIPTAWDWRFSTIKGKGLYLRITLQDDKVFGGYYGSDSFTSSDKDERDIYLQEIYDIDKQGLWHEKDDKVGILIAAKEIKHIEFWNVN